MASMQGNAHLPKHAAELIANARKLVAPGKGILAADESTGTIGKRVRSGGRVGGGKGGGAVVARAGVGRAAPPAATAAPRGARHGPPAAPNAGAGSSSSPLVPGPGSGRAHGWRARCAQREPARGEARGALGRRAAKPAPHPLPPPQLSSIGVDNVEDNRRALRQMLFTAPGVEAHISGVILYEETLYQAASDGTPFVDMLAAKGMLPGIKVDSGVVALAGTDGETTTQGVDDLGARAPPSTTPPAPALPSGAPCSRLATTSRRRWPFRRTRRGWRATRRGAKAAGLVPIVEPEDPDLTARTRWSGARK